MDKICLDTDFLIDALRGKKAAADFLLSNAAKATFAITYVTLYELYRGAFNSTNPELEVMRVEKLKSRFELLNLSEESVKVAGAIRVQLSKKGDNLDVRDLFIGTIALVNGFSVKTNNVRHFNKITGLKVV